MSAVRWAAPRMVQPVIWSERSSRTAVTPFLGAQTGFRGALLRAVEAGWLCKASRGAGDGGMVP
jgi:hypothetical protein